ncbi:MAG: inositol 2-dehydrogenase [Acidobacteria bacterium]|nr:MAG: inositol 2-dehydrogenase [Acidobacteriota bacterium]
MSRGKLRFAVLGVGRIGKVHIANLATRIPDVEVLAIADVSAGEAAAVACRFGVPQVFQDYKQLLKSVEVDAVVVCTPTNTHHDIIRDAVSAGKHVFCEKPVDLTLERIQRILQHVERSGVQLMVGFNRRFDPNFQKLHEIVKAGRIGTPEIVRITSRDPAPPPEQYLRAAGGLFLDMTIHDFDMARYLAGSDVVEVYAHATVLVDPVFRAVGDWDTAAVILRFENGAVGTIDNSRRAVYGYDQRAEVFGSAGMAAIGNNAPDNHVFFDRSGGHSSPPLDFFMERYTESYLREMQAFVDAVRDGKPVPVNGTDGLVAVAIGLTAAKSARENRPVPVSEIYAQTAATS